MSAGPLVVTLDLDWACELAIEETLSFLESGGIPSTVFATHTSPSVVARMSTLEVGLHPYFDPESSHGQTNEEVVAHVLALPHNLKAFRCHRFAVSNASREAMGSAGYRISSNVCTDLEVLSPFRDRFGHIEVPIFLEDGGYLYREHPLRLTEIIEAALVSMGPKVLLLHPMHFAINTPNFRYMTGIKQSVTRQAWIEMSRMDIDALRWRGRGIRDFVLMLFEAARKRGLAFTTLGALAEEYGATQGIASGQVQTSTRKSRA